MKSILRPAAAAALFLLPAIAAAQDNTASDSVPPVVTIDTPAVLLTRNAIISGTATDTGASGSTVVGGVREVWYQFEGQSKWRRATLTNRGGTETTWLIKTKVKGTRGKRIYFRAVDGNANESDIVGRRFRQGS